MSALEFRILGPLEVARDGQLLPLGGPKQRATLAMLLLARSRVVSREELVDGLWGTAPPPTALATLEAYVSRLRRVLGEDGSRLVRQPPGYRLDVEPGELDLDAFEQLVETGRAAALAGDAAAGSEALGAALSHFRGPPLGDVASAPFAGPSIGRLDDLRLEALERRIDADLECGRHADVAAELEELTASHPYREGIWRRLMLALYRGGRQGEALAAYKRARRGLAEELGLEPGAELRRMQHQILNHDPSLDPPRPAEPPAPAKNRRGSRRRVVIVGLATFAAMLGVVALVLARGTDSVGASPQYRPGTALVDASSGEPIRQISSDQLSVAAYPVVDGDSLWVNDWKPNSFVQIDAATGEILRRITPPARDPGIHEDFATVTPFTVRSGSLWTVSGDDVVRMDVELGQEVERFQLDELGLGAGLAEGVAVGGGSLWVSRSVGKGQLLRLNLATGALERSWRDTSPYLNLAFADDALWIADTSGLARIDADTSVLRRVGGIAGNCVGGDGGCVAAGGGFGWTSDAAKGVVYKVDAGGRIAEIYETGIGTGFLSYSRGMLWARNRNTGTLLGIDSVTGARREEFDLGHPVQVVAAAGDAVLVTLEPGAPLEDRLATLPGDVATFFADPGQLGGDEPALNTAPGAYQIEFATCAMLLNYRDTGGEEGWRLEPEVAAGMPTVSSDGRTYKFVVRDDFRFAPPSGQTLTAETFRYSIERALSPKLADNPVGAMPPGPLLVDDIRGERAFLERRARHISGLRSAGSRLTITLTRPSPDFLARLATPYFCPVPIGTPPVAGAMRMKLPSGVLATPSAGPYYVADAQNGGYVLLLRNPHYSGPRPRHLDAIVIREDAGATAALRRIEDGASEGITALTDPLLSPDGPINRRWGSAAQDRPAYLLTPQASTRYIAFNAQRGAFASPRVRRAAWLALDRLALARVWGVRAGSNLVSEALPGGTDRGVPAVDLTRALKLMAGRRETVLMAIPSNCGLCRASAGIVRRNLAAIGITVRVRLGKDPRAADLIDTEASIAYPDTGSFVRQVITELPPGWASARTSAWGRSLADLSGTGRELKARLISRHLADAGAQIAPYGIRQIAEVLAPSIGCRTLSPVAHGVDLASLCLTDVS